MIEIKTFLKYNDDFIDVEDEKKLKNLYGRIDEDYIEGAITMSYWSEEIIGLRHWDLVDQLWAYIITMLHDCLTNGKAEFLFPDQPLKAGIELIKNGMCLFTVGNGAVSKRCSIPFKEFAEKSLCAYKDFVYKMKNDLGVLVYADHEQIYSISEALSDL